MTARWSYVTLPPLDRLLGLIVLGEQPGDDTRAQAVDACEQGTVAEDGGIESGDWRRQ